MTEHFAPLVLGEGPGLLLAHGAGGGVRANFGPLLDDLARTHTVVGADYPAAGGTLDELADGLVATAVDAGVEQFTVLGYSLGTAVAVRVATRHPDRVTGLILTAGLARPDARMELALDVWAELLKGDRTLLAKFLMLTAFSEQFLATLTPEQLTATVAGLAESVPAGTAKQVELVRSVDTRAELASIAVPTLVIATTLDALVPPRHSRELADGIPGAELVEIESGHGITDEAPDAWLTAIRKVLR
ncbi:alpha/beta fold hydrolase [Amycolatopsis sp. NPDC059090]|uniref:alpha/beta fold hydrolase n=1 Tax=unclassified Amycolatopsis TaxID=2618356 RepID=UPI00366DAC03